MKIHDDNVKTPITTREWFLILWSGFCVIAWIVTEARYILTDTFNALFALLFIVLPWYCLWKFLFLMYDLISPKIRLLRENNEKPNI